MVPIVAFSRGIVIRTIASHNAKSLTNSIWYTIEAQRYFRTSVNVDNRCETEGKNGSGLSQKKVCKKLNKGNI